MDQQITAVIVNRKENKLKVYLKGLFLLLTKIISTERMRLSSRFIYIVHFDRDLFSIWFALVCGGHRLVNNPCEFVANGFTNSGTRGSSQFSRYSRTTCHANWNFRSMWFVYIFYTRSSMHSYGSSLWSIFIHGYIFLKWISGKNFVFA